MGKMSVFLTFVIGVFGVGYMAQSAPLVCPSASEDIRKPAAINRAAMMLSVNEDLSRDLIVNYNNMREEMNRAHFQAEEFIPTNMDPNQDRRVLSQIADRAANTFWNSPSVRSSVVGRTATSVEKNMQTNVEIQDAHGVEHHFNLNFQAFQATAQMSYEGFTRANLRYAATESSLGIEVREASVYSSDLVLSHTVKPSDEISRVSLEWKF